MADTSSAAPKKPGATAKPASAEALASRMAAALDVKIAEPEPAAPAAAPKAAAPEVKKPAASGPPPSEGAHLPTPDLEGMYRLVKDGMTRMTRTMESVQDNAKDTTKLVFGSRTIVAEHTVAIQRKMLEMMEANFTAGLRTIQALTRASNVSDAVGIHSSYCKEALKSLQGQAETLRSLSSSLAKDVREPFEAQVSNSVARMKSALRPN